MKSSFIKIFLFVNVLFLVFSCENSTDKSSSGTTKAKIEKPIDDGKVRRFTFALKKPIVDLKSSVGNFDFDLFDLNGKTFLIVDAPSNFDFEKLKKGLMESAPAVFLVLEKSTPLDRIYKLEQKKQYTSKEGQLIQPTDDSKRYVLTLEIVNDPDLRKEYIEIHGIGKAWPEITKNMKQVGVKDMEIYLEGYQAYLIMDTKQDFDFAKDGETWSSLPRESEWQNHVAKFQKVNPKSKTTEKWLEMKQM